MLKRYRMLVVMVGIVLVAVTGLSYGYENYYFTGEHMITGRFLYSRNADPVLCRLQFDDDSMVWMPLKGMTQEQVDLFTGHNVTIHYAQTVTGKCRLISIMEAT